MEFQTRVTAFTAHFELPLTQSLSDFFLTVEVDVLFDAVGKSLPLWIDALCINQQDAAEVNQQVLLMGDIYNLCRQTIVWLGPDADDGGRLPGTRPGDFTNGRRSVAYIRAVISLRFATCP